MADLVFAAAPLPASPARGEVPTVGFGYFVRKQLDRNTSPLVGEAGRGVSPALPRGSMK